MKKSVYDADGSVGDAGGIAEYVEAHSGGGGDTFWVNFTEAEVEIEDAEAAYNSDKTIEEILEAAESGMEIKGRGDGLIYPWTGNYFEFLGTSMSGRLVSTKLIPADENTLFAKYTYMYTLTPVE